MPFAYLLTSSVALLTSTLGILVRDTQMIMQALMRILFYMSPILWVPKNHGVSGIIHKIMMFNPGTLSLSHIVQQFYSINGILSTIGS